MQINSTSSNPPQPSVALAVENQVRVAEQRERIRVQQEAQEAQQAQQTNQQQAGPVERFDVGEQALALVAQAQLNASQAELQGALLSSPTNSPSNQANKPAAYDSPSQQNQSAIAA